jgi:hypothetical protein
MYSSFLNAEFFQMLLSLLITEDRLISPDNQESVRWQQEKRHTNPKWYYNFDLSTATEGIDTNMSHIACARPIGCSCTIWRRFDQFGTLKVEKQSLKRTICPDLLTLVTEAIGRPSEASLRASCMKSGLD